MFLGGVCMCRFTLQAAKWHKECCTEHSVNSLQGAEMQHSCACGEREICVPVLHGCRDSGSKGYRNSGSSCCISEYNPRAGQAGFPGIRFCLVWVFKKLTDVFFRHEIWPGLCDFRSMKQIEHQDPPESRNSSGRNKGHVGLKTTGE